jgi:hypothetical protein
MQNSKARIILIVAFIALANVALLAEMNLSYVGIIGLLLTVLLVYSRPEVLLVIFVIATSTTTAYHLFPKIIISDVDFYFTDILLILAFMIIFIKQDLRKMVYRLKNPVTYALLFFMFFVILAIVQSLQDGGMGDLTKAIAVGRPLLYYIIFIPTLIFLKDEKKAMWFVKALIVLCILVSCYMLFTAIFGRTMLQVWLKTAILKRSIIAVDIGNEGMILRQGRLRDIPGIALVIIILPIVIGLLVYNWKGKSLILYYSALFLGIITIVLNFTRTVWVSYVLMALLLLCMVRSKGHRYVNIAIASVVFLIVSTMILMLSPKYSDVGIVSFASKRFISFFVENVNTSTAIQRIVETKAALDELESHYLWGIGMSEVVEKKKIVYNDQEYYMTNIESLHNSYLNFVFKIGFPSLIAYLILIFIALRRSYLLFKNTERTLVKGISIGIFLSYMRIMINAVSQHYFWHMPSIAPITYLFALTEVLIDLDRKKKFVESPSKVLVKREQKVVSVRR